MASHTPRPPLSGWQRSFVLFVDRQIYRLSRHWLAFLNLGIGIYVLLPTLAPVLMAYGSPQLARVIYLAYGPACHQLPERSFFLFGAKPVYTLDELWALGLLSQANIFERKLFWGTPQIGYKIAICQRDVALYGGFLLGGLLFGLLRRRIRPLSFLIYGLCLLPLVIDGGTQLLFLRESNWILRTLTGGLAGLASVWTLYPHIEAAFQEVRQQAEDKIKRDPNLVSFGAEHEHSLPSQ